MNIVRRKFIGTMALLGTSGLLSASWVAKKGAPGAAKSMVEYDVQGFTCVTCAVGLEVLLQRQKGVLDAAADYHAATASIEFDPQVVTDKDLQAFIHDAGFRVSGIRFRN